MTKPRPSNDAPQIPTTGSGVKPASRSRPDRLDLKGSPNMSDPNQVKTVAGEIFALLQTLSTPRDAANALCLANVLLIEGQSDKPPTLRNVQDCAGEMSVQIIANWMLRNASAAAKH